MMHAFGQHSTHLAGEPSANELCCFVHSGVVCQAQVVSKPQDHALLVVLLLMLLAHVSCCRG